MSYVCRLPFKALFTTAYAVIANYMGISVACIWSYFLIWVILNGLHVSDRYRPISYIIYKLIQDIFHFYVITLSRLPHLSGGIGAPEAPSPPRKTSRLLLNHGRAIKDVPSSRAQDRSCHLLRDGTSHVRLCVSRTQKGRGPSSPRPLARISAIVDRLASSQVRSYLFRAATASKPRCRSAMMSSASSMPMERRIVDWEMPASASCSGVSSAWVVS